MDEFSPFAAMRALATQFAAFEALLLLATAAHKGVKWPSSRQVMQDFVGVPRLLAPAVLAGAMLLECVTAVLLLVPSQRATGALLAASIWALYLTLLVRAVVQGRRDVDCGCSFGSTHSVGVFQLARNGVLLALAVCIAVDAVRGPNSAASRVQGSQVLAACALLALYGAVDQVMALRPLRSGEIL